MWRSSLLHVDLPVSWSGDESRERLVEEYLNRITEGLGEVVRLSEGEAEELGVEKEGCYSAEANLNEKDWQKVFWGPHYEKLLEIKKKWDPRGIFTCTKCVGSEWVKEVRDSRDKGIFDDVE